MTMMQYYLLYPALLSNSVALFLSGLIYFRKRKQPDFLVKTTDFAFLLLILAVCVRSLYVLVNISSQEEFGKLLHYVILTMFYAALNCIIARLVVLFRKRDASK